MTISIRCDGCGATYNVPDKMAGKKAKCTKCGQMLTVAPVKQPPQPLASEKIGATCQQCGSKYSVGIAMAGKRAKCTKCGGVFEVPDPNALVELEPIAAVVADDPFAVAGGNDWSDPLHAAMEMPAASMPLARPGSSRPTAKKSSGKGVPLIVWLGAGGVGGALLLILLLVVMFLVFRGGDDESGSGNGGGGVASNGGTGSNTATTPGASTKPVEKLPAFNDAVAWTWKADLPVAGPADLAQQPLKLIERPDKTFMARGDVAQATIAYRRNPSEQNDVLIQRLDLKTGTALAEQAFVRNTKLLDLSQDGTTFLILPGANYASNETLQVWRWSDKKAQQVGQWTPYQDQSAKRIAWSMMIDANRIATGHSQEKAATIWDASGKQISRFSHEGNMPPRLSPGGKYLVQHSGLWLRFLEAATIKHVGSIGPLSADYMNFSSLAYRPDGNLIAATFQHPGGRTFVAWNAADRKKQFEFAVPILASPLFWHDDDYVLAGGYLLSLSHEMPVWYYMGLKPFSQSIDHRAWHHLSAGREQYLVAASVPSPEVQSNIEKYVAANVPILKAGDTVGVQVQIKGSTPSADLPQKLTKTLTSHLQVAGYMVGEDQPFRLRVSLQDKDTGRQLEYHTMGALSGSDTISVPDRRIQCEVAFVDSEENVVWRTKTSIGPSSLSFTRSGQTDFAKNLLDSRWKSLDSWIDNVRIAPLVRKFSSTGQFGSSMLQADGERIVKVPVN